MKNQNVNQLKDLTMKTKIKVKVLTKGCMPTMLSQGDWIDLRSAETISFKFPQAESRKIKVVDGKQVSYRNVQCEEKMIPLGVAIKLPEGFEAIMAPRSSTYKDFGMIARNSIGIIDNSYCGNQDEWKFPAVALKESKKAIEKGDRICQFRIQLTQKATFWQKLKWLLSSGVELVEVDDLSDNNRGGLGSTGVK